MDYTRMKAVLLKEYIRSGGKNARDFLTGITWFENMLTEYDEERLNESVPEKAIIRNMQKEMESKDKIIRDKDQKINNKVEQYKALYKKWQNFLGMKKKQLAEELKSDDILEMKKELQEKDNEIKFLKMKRDELIYILSRQSAEM